MQPVSANFLAALRGPHTISVRVDAWRLNPTTLKPELITGDLRVLSGEVTAEASGTASPRRSLTMELEATQGLWDTLSPAGTYLTVSRGVRFVDGTIERVALGKFDLDEMTLDHGPSGGISITAPDFWVRISRARFETPRVTGTGSGLDAAVSLATEATRTNVGANLGDRSITARRAVWETDREQAITELARNAGAWVYCDVNGDVATRKVPGLDQVPVWTVDASESGVLLSADRSRSRQRTYNVVVVSPSDTDGTTPFAPVVVADTDPTSPTYVGTFGRVPFFFSNALSVSPFLATTIGQALLRDLTGLAAQLDLSSVVNAALEPGDVIDVLLPARAGDTRVVERHLIDRVTIPLTSEGTQSISTRSTRPEGDVPGEVF